MKNPYDIAIVAMGGVFPEAPTVDALWAIINEKRSAAGPVSPERWIAPPQTMVNRSLTDDRAISDTACIIRDFNFDPTGYAFPADQLQHLDPMHQIVLTASRQALANGVLTAVDPTRVATFLAAIALPTDGASEMTRTTLGQALEAHMLRRDSTWRPALPDADLGRRSKVVGYPAALVSRAFGFGGPTLTLDAACASSLYAVQLACDALTDHRADAVIAGGVSRPEALFTQVGFSQLRALSPSGRCAPFDHRADGLVVGEGAGVLVLKRTDDARAAGEPVLGIIRAVGMSNDLRGNLLAPDTEGQIRAMNAAYAQSKWSPDSIDLVECHGAGTPVGDAAELASLTAVWKGIDGSNAGKCTIGSVKSNVGHLLTAAGAAGLIKVVLSLTHATLPPTCNFERPGPDSPLMHSPFRILGQAEPWPSPPSRARRAAVSAFGFGGINAHLLVEGPPPTDAVTTSVETLPTNARATHSAEPVAVVGMAAAAGEWSDIDAFYRALMTETPALGQIPADRWPDRSPLVRMGVRGSFMTRLSVTANRFRIPPKELPDILDPHLIMLTIAADALADAGMTQRRHRPRMGSVIGIDFDMAATDYHLRWDALTKIGGWAHTLDTPLTEAQFAHWSTAVQDTASPPLTASRVLGSLGSMVASRLAREFGFGGHTYTVSDDAAGGIKALEIAVRSLQDQDTDAMLAGAVDLTGDIRRVIRRLGHLDSQTQGETLLADGAVAMVLMRLSDARDAGCRIYGVIDGIGATSAVSASETDWSDAVQRAAAQALAEADIQPETIGLPVCHGSDRTAAAHAESRFLSQALGSTTLPEAVDAAMANAVQQRLGHAGAATGLLGLTLALLAVSTGTRPSWTESSTAGDLPWPMDDTGVRRALATVMTAEGGVMMTLLSSHGAPIPWSEHRHPPAHQSKTSVFSRPIAARVYESPPVSGPARSAPPTKPHLPAPPVSSPVAETGSDSPSSIIGQPAATDAMGGLTAVMSQVRATSDATARAHQDYLNLNARLTRQMADGIRMEAEMTDRLAHADGKSAASPSGKRSAAPPSQVSEDRSANSAEPEMPETVSDQPSTSSPMFDRDQCLEFAKGSAGAVLGPAFADIDAYPARVRLPDEPLMFVDRIIRIEGEPDRLGGGRIITEHDVRDAAWYLDGGRAPVSVAVEAGQADLFLCAWLGIDHRIQGKRNYRLLDAQVEFHRDLPRPGETIRYDIRIDRFIRQAETYLFFFRFTGTIDGAPLITMTNGCAGFFTPEEVANSGGIILSPEDREPFPGILPGGWEPAVPIAGTESYSDAQLAALRRGDVRTCFGPGFAGRSPAPALRLPGDRLHLIDRVQLLDPDGGRYGLGRVEAVADVTPDAWYLTCHFVDDMTMPGTLMYECCAQTLRVFMQRIGWYTSDETARYEPVHGIHSRLKCRGPVTPATQTVVYAVDIREIRLTPEPAIIADAHMTADGRYIVMFQSIAMRLAGVTADALAAYWGIAKQKQPAPQPKPALPKGPPTRMGAAAGATRRDTKSPSPPRTTGAIPESPKRMPGPDGVDSPAAGPAEPGLIFSREQVLAFARGKPSDAFGALYQPFDGSRFIARLPSPPYSFLDRITAADAVPWQLGPTGWITGAFDVAPDHWYFAADRSNAMPFCVLLEIALQSCGWLAAYLGSALHSRHDMKFRNLGGTAILHRQPQARSHTLTVRARLTRVSKVVDMIVERFEFSVSDENGPIYEGETEFGFFTLAALATQVGIRGADDRRWQSLSADTPAVVAEPLPKAPPTTPDDPERAPGTGMVMPSTALMMIDTIDGYYPLGGSHQMGFVRAMKTIHPKDWYFAAHFYQDPVCPGSLGIEALLQTIKWTARRIWPDKIKTHRFEIAGGTKHRWAYRGQILPYNRSTTVEADVVRIDNSGNHSLYADGFLLVDGLPIYEMNGFGIQLTPKE